MISWTKLITGKCREGDRLRYSTDARGRVKIVVWNITPQCNLRCMHCYYDASHERGAAELTHAEAEDFINDLSRIGSPVLIFSGGEPLMRRDIFDLGRLACDRGIRPALSTNGTLITHETALKIMRAGFSYVGISLDGGSAANDIFRQDRGAFDHALAGLRNCQDVGLRAGLRFTLTRYNLRELAFIFELTEREAVSRLCLYHLVYSGRARDMISQDLDHSQTRQAMEFVWQRTLEFGRSGLGTEILTVDNHADGVWIYLRLKAIDRDHAECAMALLKAQGGNMSGVNMAALGSSGDVYADQFLRTHPLGNVRQRRFSRIWRDGGGAFLPALRDRKSRLSGRCKWCGYLAICNGNFRARAEAVFGDIWQEDPACYLTDEEIGKSDEAYSATGCLGVDA